LRAQTYNSASVANALAYQVIVTGHGVYWQSADLPLTSTSILFNADSTATGGNLVSGLTYEASVTIFNLSGDTAFRTIEFTMP